MLCKSVHLAAGQRVRLPSGSLCSWSAFCLPWSPFLLITVPLLVGHCVRLFPLLFLLSPFLLVLVSALSPFLSPFVSGLVSLLVGHCVSLLSLLFPFFSLLVSLLVGHCVRLVSLLSPFVSGLVSLLVGHCVRLVSLLFPFVSLLVSLVVPLLVGHCVRLVFLLSFTFASSLPLSLATLHICLPAALPCNSTFVSQLWAACRLQSFTLSFVSLCLHVSPSSGLLCSPLPCNPLHLSPSSGLLCPPLPCNPLHLSRSAGLLSPSSDCCDFSPFALQSFTCVLASLCICLPALDCCIRLCLAILCLPALDVANSSCRVFRY